MNIVLFLTQNNLSEIEAFTRKAGELQKERVNGALVIVHQDSITPEVVARIAEPIRPLFPPAAVGTISVSLNNSFDNAGKVSSMFSIFIMKSYAKFPGPWLVVDSGGVPRKENFMQELERQHNSFGSKISGRGIVEPGALTPVGPVVINLPARDLKSLLSHTGESWRSRGRYLYARSSFGLVHPDDYLFTLSQAESQAASSKSTPARPTGRSESEPAVNIRPPIDPAALEQVDRTPAGVIVNSGSYRKDGENVAYANAVESPASVAPSNQYEANREANQEALSNPNISPGVITPTLGDDPASTQILTGAGVVRESDATPHDPVHAPATSPMDDVPHTVPTPSTGVSDETPAAEQTQPAGVDTVTTGEGAPGEVVPPRGVREAEGELATIADGDEAPDASSLMGRDYGTLSREQLFNLMWFRTGERPHPRIGVPTLVSRLTELDEANQTA